MQADVAPLRQATAAQPSLDLTGKQLQSIPALLNELTSLEVLILDDNQLTALPASIGQLTNLKTLSLYRNQLTTAPETIWQLIHR